MVSHPLDHLMVLEHGKSFSLLLCHYALLIFVVVLFFFFFIIVHRRFRQIAVFLVSVARYRLRVGLELREMIFVFALELRIAMPLFIFNNFDCEFLRVICSKIYLVS